MSFHMTSYKDRGDGTLVSTTTIKCDLCPNFQSQTHEIKPDTEWNQRTASELMGRFHETMRCAMLEMGWTSAWILGIQPIEGRIADHICPDCNPVRIREGSNNDETV